MSAARTNEAKFYTASPPVMGDGLVEILWTNADGVSVKLSGQVKAVNNLLAFTDEEKSLYCVVVQMHSPIPELVRVDA